VKGLGSAPERCLESNLLDSTAHVQQARAALVGRAGVAVLVSLRIGVRALPAS
jgi:hypothetical protein